MLLEETIRTNFEPVGFEVPKPSLNEKLQVLYPPFSVHPAMLKTKTEGFLLEAASLNYLGFDSLVWRLLNGP